MTPPPLWNFFENSSILETPPARPLKRWVGRICLRSGQLFFRGSKQYQLKGVVEIAIKTGDQDYAGTDVPMQMKICDQDTCLSITDVRGIMTCACTGELFTLVHFCRTKIINSPLFNFICLSFFPLLGSTGLWSWMVLDIQMVLDQGGRTWQPFVGGKNGPENFRQTRIYNFRNKCVVFARNSKFANLTQ